MPALHISVVMYMAQLMDRGNLITFFTSVFYSIKWIHSINSVHDPKKDLTNYYKKLQSVCVSNHLTRKMYHVHVHSLEMIQTLCLI